jgi:hypothetical protein
MFPPLLRLLCWTIAASSIPLPIGHLDATEPVLKGSKTSLADATPIDWLPTTTIAHLKIEPAKDVVDHPIRKRIQESEVFRKIWLQPELMQLRGGLTVLEFVLGDRVDSLLKRINHGGMHVAYDRETKGLVILSKTESEEWLVDYLDKLKTLALNDAKSKKKPNPIQEKDYRGIKGTKLQDVIVAPLGDWLMVTNKPNLAKEVIDRFLEPSLDTLAANKPFQAAKNQLDQITASAGEQHVGTLFLDVESIRNAGMAKKLFDKKPKDFGAELILGGLLVAVEATPLACSRLYLSDDGLRLISRIPFDSDATGDSRDFFYGPKGKGTAPKLFGLADSMASASAYRNASLLWLRAGDLFDQKVNDQLAQADNTLTTLFSGKDFGEDILGAIEPELQLVVAKQVFAQEKVPSIKLPSFALIGTLKDPAKMQRELKRTFQSLVGFLNIVGAMEGQPQLELMTDSSLPTGPQFHWAEYLFDSDKKYDNGLPIQFNFTPCIAFDGPRVVVSSTMPLAKEILKQQSSKEPAPASVGTNTNVQLDVASLKEILNANRETLIANNILEKGHSRDKAEKEIDLLMSILGMFKELAGTLRFDQCAEVSLQLSLKGE